MGAVVIAVMLSLGISPVAWARGSALPVEQIAVGVFVIPSPLADPGLDNRGRVVNTGFIVGESGVVVIDSGANYAHGQAIIASIERQTRKPIRLLINTHPHPQNVLGNSAFAAKRIPILATKATRLAMNERCPLCLKALGDSVGADAMKGTSIRLPDEDHQGVERQTIAGRRLRLLHFGHGHTEGDMAIFDEESGTLFAGDLAYHGQIPHLAESNTLGWIAALEQLAALPIRRLVPGRGATGEAVDLNATGRYLRELRTTVERAYAQGLSATEIIGRAELPEFAGWHGYATRHGRNVQHLYFEIEREDLARGDTR